jgi:hypothetical protein
LNVATQHGLQLQRDIRMHLKEIDHQCRKKEKAEEQRLIKKKDNIVSMIKQQQKMRNEDSMNVEKKYEELENNHTIEFEKKKAEIRKEASGQISSNQKLLSRQVDQLTNQLSYSTPASGRRTLVCSLFILNGMKHKGWKEVIERKRLNENFDKKQHKKA